MWYSKIILGCLAYLMLISPFVVLGSVGLHHASRIDAAQRRASRWPSVRGQLLAADAPEFQPEVRYTYRVGNSGYASQQFALLDIRTGKSWARQCVEELRREQSEEGAIAVHYDPNDPAQAVVYVGSDQVWVTIGTSSFSFMVAIALTSSLLCGAWRGLTRQKQLSAVAARH